MTTSLTAALDQLNACSRQRWGANAPIYSARTTGRSPRLYFIHRHQSAGPWLPAVVLFARGSKDHCLARVRAALRHASAFHG